MGFIGHPRLPVALKRVKASRLLKLLQYSEDGDFSVQLLF